MKKATHLSQITPGEILAEDFMKPQGLSQAALAAGLGVMPMTVNQIVHGKLSISAEVALRLGRSAAYLSGDPENSKMSCIPDCAIPYVKRIYRQGIGHSVPGGAA